MATTKTYTQYLSNGLAGPLANLTVDTQPSFGILTPQHMLEHLIISVKMAMKRKGEPPITPEARHAGFKKFIAAGAVFEHRPKEEATLPPLKLASIDEAKDGLIEAGKKFETHFTNNPEFLCYNSFMGELGYNELALFHYNHCRFHFWQFGLLPEFP